MGCVKTGAGAIGSTVSGAEAAEVGGNGAAGEEPTPQAMDARIIASTAAGINILRRGKFDLLMFLHLWELHLCWRNRLNACLVRIW